MWGHGAGGRRGAGAEDERGVGQQDEADWKGWEGRVSEQGRGKEEGGIATPDPAQGMTRTRSASGAAAALAAAAAGATFPRRTCMLRTPQRTAASSSRLRSGQPGWPGRLQGSENASITAPRASPGRMEREGGAGFGSRLCGGVRAPSAACARALPDLHLHVHPPPCSPAQPPTPAHARKGSARMSSHPPDAECSSQKGAG